MASRAAAESLGLSPLAAIESHALVAGPDVRLHKQPANAILAALEKAGAAPADLAAVEINEAFAAVAVESLRTLGLNGDRVNTRGGAIALGHPIGASGARIVGTLARQLAERAREPWAQPGSAAAADRAVRSYSGPCKRRLLSHFWKIGIFTAPFFTIDNANALRCWC